MRQVSMEDIQEKLVASGYKLTNQRQAVVSVLLEREFDHLSAEEVFLYVRRKDDGIGLATVYRTLDILTELRIVDRVSFTDDGVALYDLRKVGAKHFHHHLVCDKCGQVVEIEEDLLIDVEKEVMERFKFLVKDHRLTFQGLCESCQN